VLSSALRFFAVFACAIVLLAFAMFVSDQSSSASHEQQNAIVEGNPTAVAPAVAPAKPGGLKAKIDRVDNVLIGPFKGVATSSSAWVDHGIPALLALLLYGAGLGYLARYLEVRTR
jgi:hypothetical protein